MNKLGYRTRPNQAVPLVLLESSSTTDDKRQCCAMSSPLSQLNAQSKNRVEKEEPRIIQINDTWENQCQSLRWILLKEKIMIACDHHFVRVGQ